MNKKTGEHPIVKFLGYLLDYGPIILTVVFAILFSILSNVPNFKSVSGLDLTQQWILIILAFLATTQLIDRFRFMRSLDRKMSSIDELVRAGTSAGIEILDELPDLRERARQAKSISISGQSLGRTSISYNNIFIDFLKSGNNLRLIIMDPDDERLMDTTIPAFMEVYNSDRLCREIKQARDNFARIFSGISLKKGSGVRLMQTRPTIGIWMFDEGTNQAEIWVEIYPYKDFEFLTLHLIPSRNKKWFDFFKGQYLKMWETSKSYIS